MNYSVPEKIKYVAKVEDVREVTLIANADLSYWRDHLRNDGFVPYVDNGKAELMISSADLKWKSMRSQEVSVSVKICCNDKNEPDGYFLLHAFNSSRLFAFIERIFFHTPYYYGRIAVSAEHPVSVVVDEKEQNLMMLHIPENRLPDKTENKDWNGPIFLPFQPGKKADQRKLFFAKIGGLTRVYSFQPSTDLIRLQRAKKHPVIQMLQESNLTGKEWQVRNNASHAKSKTYEAR